jgi:L-lactate dehydrogenase complex protein LldE
MSRIKASLFITCLVDVFFPGVGESMVKVLRRLGVDVHFPDGQTCCGQPAFNSGYRKDAKVLAKRFVEVFSRACREGHYIVCPSGSCTSMVKVFYAELLRGNPSLNGALDELCERTFEFSSFITNVLGKVDVGAIYNGTVTYHDSCHMLRELGVKDAPRKLIQSVKGVRFVEMDLPDTCCGFGGTFSIKYPDVSLSMLEEKVASILKSGADTLVSSDMGCLAHMGGLISRRGLPIRVMHIAELLASG